MLRFCCALVSASMMVELSLCLLSKCGCFAGTMTDNEALSARLAGFPATAPGLLQLLSFAWGTVLSAHGPDDSHSEP